MNNSKERDVLSEDNSFLVWNMKKFHLPALNQIIQKKTVLDAYRYGFMKEYR